MENLQSKKPLMPSVRKENKPWKWWQVILLMVAIMFLYRLFTGTANEVPVQVTQEETTPLLTETTKSWKEIYSFKGNGRKKSGVFHLLGNDAKLVYTYHSNSEYIGVFGVYVVTKGVDVMRDGGIPEVMIDKTNDADESTIQKQEGDYYLDVNASGNWSVKVMEMQ